MTTTSEPAPVPAPGPAPAAAKAGSNALVALEQAFQLAEQEVNAAADRAAKAGREAGEAREAAKQADLRREGADAARAEAVIERDRLRANEVSARTETEGLRAEIEKLKAELGRRAADQAPLEQKVDALSKARREAEETARKMLADRAALESRAAASEEINDRLERRVAELELVVKGIGDERAGLQRERDEARAGAKAREDELRAFFLRTLTKKGAEKLASHAMPAVGVKKMMDELIASGKLPAGGLFGGLVQ